MREQIPPIVAMVRALNRLKTALGRAGLAARLESLGTTRAVLRIDTHGIAISCRTNPNTGHSRWFWLDGEPIAAANDARSAVAVIRLRHAGAVR